MTKTVNFTNPSTSEREKRQVAALQVDSEGPSPEGDVRHTGRDAGRDTGDVQQSSRPVMYRPQARLPGGAPAGARTAGNGVAAPAIARPANARQPGAPQPQTLNPQMMGWGGFAQPYQNAPFRYL